MKSYKTPITEELSDSELNSLNQDIDALFADLKARIKDATKPRSSWLGGVKNWLSNKSQKESVSLYEYHAYNTFLQDFQSDLNENLEDIDNILSQYKDRFKTIVKAHIKGGMEGGFSWNLSRLPKINYDNDTMRAAYGKKSKKNPINTNDELEYSPEELKKQKEKEDLEKWKNWKTSVPLTMPPKVEPAAVEKPAPIEPEAPKVEPVAPVPEPVQTPTPVLPKVEPVAPVPEPVQTPAPVPPKVEPAIKPKSKPTNKKNPGRPSDDEYVKLGMALKDPIEGVTPQEQADSIDASDLSELDKDEKENYIKIAKEHLGKKKKSSNFNETPPPISDIDKKVLSIIKSKKGQDLAHKMPEEEFVKKFKDKHDKWFTRNTSGSYWKIPGHNREFVLKQYIKFLINHHHTEDLKDFNENADILKIINKYKDWIKQTNKPLMEN